MDIPKEPFSYGSWSVTDVKMSLDLMMLFVEFDPPNLALFSRETVGSLGLRIIFLVCFC